MMKRTLPLVLVLAACSSGKEPPHEKARAAQYFEQAKRRDPDATERARMLSMPEAGCAAFVLETTSGRLIYATALHCTGDDDLATWCKKTGLLFTSDGSPASCKAPIAGEKSLDFAVFEADVGLPPPADAALRLAAYEPPVDTRLRTTGFPYDAERNEKVTTTENCWVLGVSRDLEIDPDSTTANVLSFALRHNCTSFVGNSGGPTWIEGTRDAVGVGAGAVDDTSISPPDDLTNAAVSGPSSSFVALHRARLEEAGVVIVEGPGPADAGPPDAGAAPADASDAIEPTSRPPDEDDGCATGARAPNGSTALVLLTALALLRRRVSRRASR